MTSTEPIGVHLVGSVPLADAREVIGSVADILGAHVRRIPDGETGEHTNWIQWQYPRLSEHPGLEPHPDFPPRQMPSSQDGRPAVREIRVLRIRPGAAPDALTFDPGYAEHALASYATFAALKRDGLIAPDVRFQVSIPTPFAIAIGFVAPDSQLAFLSAFERSLLGEVGRIMAAVPHEELAIQWDVCLEVLAFEGLFQLPVDDLKGFVFDMLGRLGAAVPAAAELGIHLCYGDPGHRHIMEPKDTAVMTEMARGITRAVPRAVQWLHMPVPKDRADDEYLAPLRELSLPSETELYLGLVHRTDGLDGARARIAAAHKVVPRFGVATECGFGRRPADTIRPLLQLHATCARPVR